MGGYRDKLSKYIYDGEVINKALISDLSERIINFEENHKNAITVIKNNTDSIVSIKDEIDKYESEILKLAYLTNIDTSVYSKSVVMGPNLYPTNRLKNSSLYGYVLPYDTITRNCELDIDVSDFKLKSITSEQGEIIDVSDNEKYSHFGTKYGVRGNESSNPEEVATSMVLYECVFQTDPNAAGYDCYGTLYPLMDITGPLFIINLKFETKVYNITLNLSCSYIDKDGIITDAADAVSEFKYPSISVTNGVVTKIPGKLKIESVAGIETITIKTRGTLSLVELED